MSCPTCAFIPGYVFAGLHAYRVWSDGRVESRWNNRYGIGKWRTIKPVVLKDGHLKVTLCFQGVHTQRYVHDLVLEAFVGPRPQGMECCHDPDPTPSNNNLNNLRWGTRSDNVKDMIRHGRHFTPFAKPPSVGVEKVAEVRRLAAAGASTRAIAKQFALSKSTVWMIVSRKGVYSEDG